MVLAWDGVFCFLFESVNIRLLLISGVITFIIIVTRRMSVLVLYNVFIIIVTRRMSVLVLYNVFNNFCIHMCIIMGVNVIIII